MPKKLILDLTYEELAQQITAWSEAPFRTKQIWDGLYHQAYEIIAQFTTLPNTLKEKFDAEYLLTGLTPIDQIESEDQQTIKLLFQLADGATIESVLMHYHERETVCVSTQVGCAMGCIFCATGRMGYQRNLTPGEIVNQVLYFDRQLRKVGKKVTNVVFMGMGEPFHNFDNTLKAIDILHDNQGLNIGERRFTISTVGLPDQIRQFADMHRQINLAISLHTPFDEKRSKIIPINKRFPIQQVMEAMRYYLGQTNRRITIEYALIANENDDHQTADALAKLLRGMLCHVNLIPVNPIGLDIKASDKDHVLKFQRILEKHGIPCSVRLERGIEIKAGCGQLASRNKNKE
jgi:23S rRNA (adenine2503-C2)-methyltransferase